MIEIYTTSRKIREYYSSFDDTAILPKAMSIAEFEQKALHVKGRVLADDDLRILLMREASRFENFEKLKIERDFFVFLKNSTFLFRFFEELANEKVTIDEIESKDTYAQFDEHLEILKVLQSRYLELLDRENLYDRIILPSIYSINEDFIKRSEGFLFHLDGFLSKFELEIFDKISKIVDFRIEFELNRYNKKVKEFFSDFNLEDGFCYILNLSTKEIEKKEKLQDTSISAKVVSFPIRAMQCAFVTEQISLFVEDGIEPENIVVITPDEGFASMLKEFDKFKNLNFAMGESYENSSIYKKLFAIERYIRYGELEDIYRLKRVFDDEKIALEFKKVWNKKCQKDEIISLIKGVAEVRDDIFEEELFKFEALLRELKVIEVQKAFRIFLSRLKSRSVDDIGGGKVTVMGLLESRGMNYEGVIIVDFNDEFVPRRSHKDIFLNSNIRANSKLPTKSDRENLQRYYYYKLMKNAKKVSISFVENEQSFASRFLEEIGIKKHKKADIVSFFGTLFQKGSKNERYNPQFDDFLHFIKRLSSSKLKTLLTCKRKYYYRYILMLQEAKIPTKKVDELYMGNLLHEALKKAYEDLKTIDKSSLYNYLKEYILSSDDDILKEYYATIWLSRLEKFAKVEADRFNDGYRVLYLEKPLNKMVENTLLEGQIDRIDIKNGKLFIIDYKSGKLPNCNPKYIDRCSDFQLEFYYLLAKDLGEIEGLFYYDLKEAKLVKNSFLKEKMQRLEEILKELHNGIKEFPLTDKKESCRWCGYSGICGVEV